MTRLCLVWTIVALIAVTLLVVVFEVFRSDNDASIDDVERLFRRVASSEFLRRTQPDLYAAVPHDASGNVVFERSVNHARCWQSTSRTTTVRAFAAAATETCLPGAYIIGAKKSGTSSLRQMLLDLPTVFAPHTLKEPTWWTSRSAFNYPHNTGNISWYIDLYRPVTTEWRTKSRGKGVILDCTPDMFHGTPDLPFVLRAFDSRAKLLLVLRDPAERAYSDFRMMNKGTIQTDHVADEFHAAITEFIERRDLRCMPECAFDFQFRLSLRQYGDPHLGHYAFFLNRWIRAGWRVAYVHNLRTTTNFVDIDLLVLTSLDLNDLTVLRMAAQHVGVDNFRNISVEYRNVDMRTPTPMHNATRRMLNTYFADSNRALQRLVGIDFAELRS